MLQRQDDYVLALLTELDRRMDYLENDPVTTIYIGGGTPSMLSIDNIKLLTSRLRNKAIMPIEEFTMECNPDDITSELACCLTESGINRVSMGVQSFCNKRLAFLKRRHKAEDVDIAMKTLRNYGISNISIDLMFGFPEQTLEEWKEDITKAIALHPNHISAYSLMYEEGTPLFSLLENNRIKELDEEVCRTMYYTLIDMLEEAGYHQYEISNFSLPNFESKHNSNYWNATRYLGIGAAAHSYNGSSRQWNISDVTHYISAINNNNIEDIIEEKEILSEDEMYNDVITTALRTKTGIDTQKLPTKYKAHLLKSMEPMIKDGTLEMTDNHLHLTRKGLYISDSIMVDLIY